jgi:hypothetical protein
MSAIQPAAGKSGQDAQAQLIPQRTDEKMRIRQGGRLMAPVPQKRVNSNHRHLQFRDPGSPETRQE